MSSKKKKQIKLLSEYQSYNNRKLNSKFLLYIKFNVVYRLIYKIPHYFVYIHFIQFTLKEKICFCKRTSKPKRYLNRSYNSIVYKLVYLITRPTIYFLHQRFKYYKEGHKRGIYNINYKQRNLLIQSQSINDKFCQEYKLSFIVKYIKIVQKQ